jgi:hypothetical protein
MRLTMRYWVRRRLVEAVAEALEASSLTERLWRTEQAMFEVKARLDRQCEALEAVTVALEELSNQRRKPCDDDATWRRKADPQAKKSVRRAQPPAATASLAPATVE